MVYKSLHTFYVFSFYTRKKIKNKYQHFKRSLFNSRKKGKCSTSTVTLNLGKIIHSGLYGSGIAQFSGMYFIIYLFHFLCVDESVFSNIDPQMCMVYVPEKNGEK